MAEWNALMSEGGQKLLEQDFAGAVACFDSALALDPASAPKHWQRAIALYYLSRYDEGADQFEKNMAVNGSDVEEVVWRAMCDFRRAGVGEGRARLLECGEDRRIPMKEIMLLFGGTATVEDVMAAARAAPAAANRRVTAEAYGNFYCGVYLEAQGLAGAARPYIDAAAAAPSDDYMGKLMVMHAKQAMKHSRVIVGGWQLSAGHHDDFDRAKALATLSEYASFGMTTLDMGDIYTGVEELVGDSIEQRQDGGVAAGVPAPQIHTKLVPDLDLLDGKVDSAYCAAVLQRSANRLGVQCLDLVQFHWWDWGLGNHVEAYSHLAALKEAGMVSRVGVTNYDAAHMLELVDAGLPVASNQVQYSVVDTRVEGAMTAACEKHGIKLLCYGVLMGGFLNDRWLGQPEPTMESLENRSLTKYKLIIDEFGGWTLFQGLLQALRAVADAHADHAHAHPRGNGSGSGSGSSGAVSVAAVAVAWVLQQPAVGGAILGARSDRHIQTTLAGASLVLTPSDLSSIALARSGAKGPTGVFYALERVREGVHGSIMRYNLNHLHKEVHLAELTRRADKHVAAAAAGKRFPGWQIDGLKREIEQFARSGSAAADSGTATTLDAIRNKLEKSGK